MAAYRFVVIFVGIFQILNNSEAYPIKIFTPASGFNGITHYQYYETSHTNSLNFKIRADKDAHIALAAAPNRVKPWYEIVIGGWGNRRSVIRKGDTDYEQTNVPLNANLYLGFWITWNRKGEIRVGREGEKEPFMSWDDPEPVDIKYFAVSLCWDSVGTWIIEEPSFPNVNIITNNAPQKNGCSSFMILLLFLLFAIYKIY